MKIKPEGWRDVVRTERNTATLIISREIRIGWL